MMMMMMMMMMMIKFDLKIRCDTIRYDTILCAIKSLVLNNTPVTPGCAISEEETP